jgi:hypothetical protein
VVDEVADSPSITRRRPGPVGFGHACDGASERLDGRIVQVPDV